MQELITAHDDGKQDGVITLEEFQELSKDPRFCYVLDSIPSVTTAAGCSACSADRANFTGLVLGCIEAKFCK